MTDFGATLSPERVPRRTGIPPIPVIPLCVSALAGATGKYSDGVAAYALGGSYR
jgi:hypothetical protein